MRILHRWAIVLCLAWSIQAPAQERIGPSRDTPPIRATPPSGGNLVLNKSVQEELNLTADQVKDLWAGVRKVREKYKDEFAKALEPTKRAELLAKVNTETLKAVGDILKPAQGKRLKQIEFQQLIEQRGPGAFLGADVAKELQFTDKQRKRVASIFNQYNQDAGAALFTRDLEEVPKLKKKALDDIRSSLNDEQKKKLEGMTGKPFVMVADVQVQPFLMGSAEHIMKKRVQDELKLTKDQVKSIEEGLRKVNEKHGEQFAKARAGLPGTPAVPGKLQPTPNPERARELAKKIDAENKKVLAGVLKPEQANRLKQIEIQLQGIRALQNKEVVEALKLTDDQKGQVKKLDEDIWNALREMGGRGRDGRDPTVMKKRFEAQKTLFKEAADKIPSLLTPEQRRRWEAMTGVPFQLDGSKDKPADNQKEKKGLTRWDNPQGNEKALNLESEEIPHAQVTRISSMS